MNLRGDAENGPAARSLVELNGSFALLDVATDGVQRDTARLPLEEEGGVGGASNAEAVNRRGGSLSAAARDLNMSLAVTSRGVGVCCGCRGGGEGLGSGGSRGALSSLSVLWRWCRSVPGSFQSVDHSKRLRV
jgi:hypothetical protein